MRSIKSIIDSMYSKSGFMVDRSFLQGYDVVNEMLYHRFGAFDLEYDTKKYIYVFYQGIRDIDNIVKPYTLNEDAVFFFGYCGGFTVNKGIYSFMFYGIGPMVDEWYADIISEDTYNNEFRGFLNIASMSLNSEYRVETIEFFLDLAKGNIIGIKQNDNTPISKIINDINLHTQYWKVFSESLVDFLELITINDGVINY